MTFWILAVILLVFFLAASIKVVNESERLAVFRLGRFLNIVGPGLVIINPLIDRTVKVNLSEKIPGLQGLSKEELDEKVKMFLTWSSKSGHFC